MTFFREAEYRKGRKAYWDSISRQQADWKRAAKYYHLSLIEQVKRRVSPGHKVLEIGCGRGDLLASLKPVVGIGLDLSYHMVRQAKQRHPECEFVQCDAQNLPLTGVFDYIILSDLVNDLWDVQGVFRQLNRIVAAQTRLILTVQSQLWQPALSLAHKLHLANPLIDQNWLTPSDLENLLQLESFEVISCSPEILWPLGFEPISAFLNRFLVKFWPFKHIAFTNFLVSRPRIKHSQNQKKSSVSVIVPARNEAGNIKPIVESIPELGLYTELIFVEGHSNDHTYETIEEIIASKPEKNCRLYKQAGIGKADAVRLGFDMAHGDILMIYDADRTVPADQLPRFYDALVDGKGELINGVRLVYPMEDQSMRFLNMIGNKVFSWLISWMLGQEVKDTLCGTKVLWRRDYLRIKSVRQEFGDFDPFGDFDLLFFASHLNLKIIDLPIRYAARRYGQTNISRWRHGKELFRMLFYAAFRIKFR